ncbi:MAG: hypothetical protein HYZ29_25400 [Myxococcales bacterium]|nr:hypothetical protein [Myxococcales bacterium]
MMQSTQQSAHGLSPEQQNALAHAIQSNVPFVSRPFSALGDALGLSEEAVLEQLCRWQSEGKLREISAILEGSALGYDSALVAGRVPAERLDEVAAIVNAHPTVTHNYLRNHEYNLWFTLAVPSEMGLERTLSVLAARAGVPEFFPLRRTHTFKVGVNFDLLSKTSTTSVVPLDAPVAFVASQREASLFRAIQTPLPLTARPFGSLAARAGVTEEALLEFGRGHLGNAMRRYVGTFHHRQLGVRGNGMVVWRAPSDELPRLGPLLAAAPEVSHCYARNSIPGFPYTLYSMLHGPSDEACREIAAGLATRLGISDYLILFSSREYKKCRLRYFLPELDAWWADSTVARAS